MILVMYPAQYTKLLSSILYGEHYINYYIVSYRK